MSKCAKLLIFVQIVLIVLKLNNQIDCMWFLILLPLIFLLLPTILYLFISGVDFITEFGTDAIIEDELPLWGYWLNYIIVILQVVLVVLQAKQIIEISWLHLFIPTICFILLPLIHLVKLIFLLVKGIIEMTGILLLIPILCLIGFAIIFIYRVVLFIVI